MKSSVGLVFVLGVVVGVGGMFFFQQVTVKEARANGEPVVNTAIPYRNGDVNGSDPVTVDIADAVYILRWLFEGGPAPKPFLSLPATGQTKCYNGAGAEIACDSTEFPGQDGFYQAGCPTEGRFIDNGDGTVTDTCTGLMWQKDTADVNGSGSIEIESPGDVLNWQDALEYCERLSFAGHDDWRLPSLRELHSIIDYGRCFPSIDPVFSAVPHLYWSSTSAADTPDAHWRFEFGIGHNGGAGADDEDFVRAVRNAP
jgi:hypothetical protein